MEQKQILIADDETGIRDFVCRGLKDFGYQAVAAADGEEAWRLIQEQPPHLAIIDIRMPRLSGTDLCRRLRQEQGYTLPIIMLTALGTTDDIVMGLRAGADDYMVKPFKFTELIARMEALLRRSEYRPTSGLPHYGSLVVDPATHRVTCESAHLFLSATECRLLLYLMQHPGITLSKQQLLRDVWDKDFDTSTNLVDVYVHYLRSKIDSLAGCKLIHTVVGQGYRFGNSYETGA